MPLGQPGHALGQKVDRVREELNTCMDALDDRLNRRIEGLGAALFRRRGV